jgi:hypothetical protein
MAGRVELPDTCWIVLASNPVGTSAGTFLLSAAMANRMLHVEWKVNADQWVEGMISGWDDMDVTAIPDDWRNELLRARTDVASFIGVNKQNLLNQPDDNNNANGAWPSPRTWEMFSEYLAVSYAMGFGQEEILQFGSGVLGAGTALEFINWFENKDLKRPEDYLANPEKIDLPERSDQMFATLNSLVAHVTNLDPLPKKDWKSVWIVLGRAAEANKADFAALPAKILIKAKPKGYSIPEDVVKFLPALKAAGLIEA